MATTQNMAGCDNIPSNWKIVPFEDVVFFQEGPGLRKWQWTDSGMKVINVTNILGDGQVDTDNTSRFISLDEFNQKYRHFAVDDRDIVVASSGNTYGKVGRISAKNLPVMMNTSVIRFHAADEARLDDDFLYSFLRSENFENQIESFVTGSAQPNFGPSHLKQMVMPLPPLPLQRRIAGVLSAYDELMENSQRRIRLLEAMSRALYREWFVNFRFPGHEKIKRVDSAFGPIPHGWQVVCIDDVCARVPSAAVIAVAGFAAAFISSRISSKRSWMDQFQEALAQTMNEPRRTYRSKMSWTQVKKILNFWKPWNSHLPTNRYGVFVNPVCTQAWYLARDCRWSNATPRSLISTLLKWS